MKAQRESAVPRPKRVAPRKVSRPMTRTHRIAIIVTLFAFAACKKREEENNTAPTTVQTTVPTTAPVVAPGATPPAPNALDVPPSAMPVAPGATPPTAVAPGEPVAPVAPGTVPVAPPPGTVAAPTTPTAPTAPTTPTAPTAPTTPRTPSTTPTVTQNGQNINIPSPIQGLPGVQVRNRGREGVGVNVGGIQMHIPTQSPTPAH